MKNLQYNYLPCKIHFTLSNIGRKNQQKHDEYLVFKIKKQIKRVIFFYLLQKNNQLILLKNWRVDSDLQLRKYQFETSRLDTK